MQEMCVEKEMFELILCECLVLEKKRMHTSGFAWMGLGQIKERRLSSIVTFSKGTGLLNSQL